jgi:hypothetical protein
MLAAVAGHIAVDREARATALRFGLVEVADADDALLAGRLMMPELP